MAKTKWIVPAIALVICAASLIGAGYAAYAASLQDSESADVTNSFVVVSYGATPTKTNMKIDYDTVNAYTNGANSAVSYQAKNTLSKVLSFKVTEAATGDASAFTTYNAAVSGLVLKDSSDATVTLGTATANICTVVDSNEDFTIDDVKYKITTTVTANNSTMYYVIVTFTAADGNAAITDDVDDLAATLDFTLSLTAPVA